VGTPLSRTLQDSPDRTLRTGSGTSMYDSSPEVQVGPWGVSTPDIELLVVDGIPAELVADELLDVSIGISNATLEQWLIRNSKMKGKKKGVGFFNNSNSAQETTSYVFQIRKLFLLQ